jgi:D-xylono/L-arabinono-1,4-lactonase
MEPVCLADYACHTGEGPLWHPLEKRLYWVDIPQGRLFRYDPATGQHEQCLQTDPIGGFTIQEDGALLLFMAKGAIRLWHEEFGETIVESIETELDSRFNDVIADPEGRVFCGTMASADHQGRLYRLDREGTLTMVLEGLGCPNGMGFTPDLRQMHFTDSGPGTIYLFDYDRASGEISNQRVFVQVPAGEGKPDGMTVDADGNVWSARWDGGCLVQYSPQGLELQRIAFPAKKVSSVVFGGDDYTDLYITTAGGGRKAVEGAGAGCLFRLEQAAQGRAEFLSRIMR